MSLYHIQCRPLAAKCPYERPVCLRIIPHFHRATRPTNMYTKFMTMLFTKHHAVSTRLKDARSFHGVRKYVTV